MSTAICQPQSCMTPNATELLIACSAMHGSSEPVFQNSSANSVPSVTSVMTDAGASRVGSPM